MCVSAKRSVWWRFFEGFLHAGTAHFVPCSWVIIRRILMGMWRVVAFCCCSLANNSFSLAIFSRRSCRKILRRALISIPFCWSFSSSDSISGDSLTVGVCTCIFS